MKSLSASDLGRGRLRSECLGVAELSAEERRSMFEVFSRHYDCVSWLQFQRDLDAKDCVIVLRTESGRICGFSTQQLLRTSIDGIPVRAVYSGDTIIDRAYWGEQEMGKAWCRYVARVYTESPEIRLFWFLISKGYRTYLYLPLFFHDFYPRWNAPTPEYEQRVLDRLASSKFPREYDPETGLILFPQSQGQLNGKLAAVPPRRLLQPDVKYFLERNPKFGSGVELACLAEISPFNMKLFAGRIMTTQLEAASGAPEAREVLGR